MRHRNILNQIKDTFNSIILCIRFPFLYPRNRFSGRHYTNWKIREKIKKHEQLYKHGISINVCSQNCINEYKPGGRLEYSNNARHIVTKVSNINGSSVRVYLDKDSVCIEVLRNSSVKIYRYSFESILKEKCESTPIIKDVYIKETYKKLFGSEKESIGYIIELITENRDDNDLSCEFISFNSIILNPHEKYIIKFYNFIERFLGIFHCIPTYTELNGMEKGWRKAFGIQMCKDMKHALIYTPIKKENIFIKNIFSYIKAYCKGIKLLYSYRIMDIKSKYGGLRWYDAWGTDLTHKVIDKYENISYKTCRICGAEADYITTGWIDPYCKNCIDPRDIPSAAKLVIDENGHKEYIYPDAD